jgi:quercetin dioxygenase-like cupin family protein
VAKQSDDIEQPQSRSKKGSTLQLTRSSVEQGTAKGPAEWFTGDVYIDTVATASTPSRVLASLVHFMPGARTAWHRHPLGQSLFVTEGIGLVQRRGGPIEVIRPGDRVYIEPDEEHWHGATPTRLMVHLALNEVDDEHVAAHWGEHVGDDEYNAAPETLPQ